MNVHSTTNSKDQVDLQGELLLLPFQISMRWSINHIGRVRNALGLKKVVPPDDLLLHLDEDLRYLLDILHR